MKSLVDKRREYKSVRFYYGTSSQPRTKEIEENAIWKKEDEKESLIE